MMRTISFVAALLGGLAATAAAETPDSLSAPSRPRPVASAPT
ncbi:MAG TPA: hypothetical protein VN896_00965 [Methylomirabilota bacterium]|jgi:hypothetical protein|nr:hypothetical protein [Methylomirabilota bacterium]